MKAVTETGINFPAEITEDEFFAAGKTLAKIEHGMQWAIGDWYNAIPWGDKEKACEKVGLSYNSAKAYGRTAMLFQMDRRLSICSFEHHRIIAIDAIPEKQQDALLNQAADNKWTSRRLAHEKNKLLGKPEKVVVTGLDDKVSALVETLPPSTSKKIKRGIVNIAGELKHTFQDQVEVEVKRRLEMDRARITKLREDLESEREQLRKARLGVDGLMTEAEYKKLRSFVHPDKATEERKRIAGECFLIVERLKNSIHPQTSKAVRKQRGWA